MILQADSPVHVASGASPFTATTLVALALAVLALAVAAWSGIVARRAVAASEAAAAAARRQLEEATRDRRTVVARGTRGVRAVLDQMLFIARLAVGGVETGASEARYVGCIGGLVKGVERIERLEKGEEAWGWSEEFRQNVRSLIDCMSVSFPYTDALHVVASRERVAEYLRRPERQRDAAESWNMQTICLGVVEELMPFLRRANGIAPFRPEHELEAIERALREFGKRSDDERRARTETGIVPVSIAA